MFDKILIANRGEIACRVLRTARRLGIGTVAVYSDADACALHVTMADEARRIGPAEALASYLCPEPIIAAALAAGCQAIHPGYGFLAENADFAEACTAAGLVFIGPPAAAIRAMGSKIAAKRLMEKVAPVIPGYHGESQESATLKKEARQIGYPVLIKASAGGGGKGMRVVQEEASFAQALAGARREAMAAFGDDRMLLEKYLDRPRHVEIQVFADSHGNAVHLFERDCSIQRRHQKVLEEAPAPGLKEWLRELMGGTAVAAAKAIGYVGAGTVEFLLDKDESYYFMEMNTRLQVEHPVTELITGLDLVEWQLRVAAGEPLPKTQEELAIRGHAIEARIYAEDPARDFLPATGTLLHLRPPQESAQVRVDTGVRQGDAITVHYDPLIAKLVVWDEDRDGALRQLRKALAAYQIAGLTTNIPFLIGLVRHPAYLAGDLDTGLIERDQDLLCQAAPPASDQVLALGSLYLVLQRSVESAAAALASADPWSPWQSVTGWRLNAEPCQVLRFLENEEVIEVGVRLSPDGYTVNLPASMVHGRARLKEDGTLAAELDGARVTATVVHSGSRLTVFTVQGSRRLTLEEPLAHQGEQDGEGGRLTAPMPGKIVAVLVEPGDRVERGTPLLILEAMKMEHTIAAPHAGMVAEVRYGVGELVSEGAVLLAFVEEG